MNRRRALRITGTVLAAAGALVLIWVVIVWRWQDPFTALYTHWKQHQLAASYNRRFAAYTPSPRLRSAVITAVDKSVHKVVDLAPLYNMGANQRTVPVLMFQKTVKVEFDKLAKLALKDTDSEGISDLLNGQTCVAYSADPVSAAKVSVKYSRENEKLVILGGAMGKTVMDVNAVKALADLPSLDQLRATLIGLIQAPATKIARVLMEPGAMLARVVQAQGAKGSEGAKSA